MHESFTSASLDVKQVTALYQAAGASIQTQALFVLSLRYCIVFRRFKEQGQPVNHHL